MSTIQDIFQEFYSEYKESYRPNMFQEKVANDLMKCRTQALGGHVYQCDQCDHHSIHYNSCRNRHCPLCQGLNKEVWVDKRNQDLLDAPYFHAVFTLPHELHPLIYQNQRLLYNLMYKTVSKTLLELSMDDKYLGAKIGFFCVLHTWSKDLHYHPHIHVVIMAGGLTKANDYRRSKKTFFLPVKVLSKMFRGKYLYYLKQYHKEGQLNFYGQAKEYEESKAFKQLINQCYEKNWYTYAKETFSGPAAVIRYLGRYTHRIAISNNRIISMDKDSVTFVVKKDKTITLKATEFIRRFLMHTLPSRFVKIRYYGILANRNKKKNIALCRKLTASPIYPSKYEGLKKIEIVSIIAKRDVTKCPTCKKGTMALTMTHHPQEAVP